MEKGKKYAQSEWTHEDFGLIGEYVRMLNNRGLAHFVLENGENVEWLTYDVEEVCAD